MVQCLRALYAVRGNQVWPHLQYIQYAQKCQTATAAEGSYGKGKTTGTSHVAYHVAYKYVLEEIIKSL